MTRSTLTVVEIAASENSKSDQLFKRPLKRPFLMRIIRIPIYQIACESITIAPDFPESIPQ